ncbi:hypothetical protein M513_08606 [Trichuris suis]|uniref:MULE transposase domain-containing protein n=1 Tax=Trichuris suis TaxID=68888 RepID=A0A085LZZ2_9BILA|nr:hypothetical protein M513_08606 [Trichuris suis]
MEETCITVASKRGFDKLNVAGYLMQRERTRNEKSSWRCEKNEAFFCRGRAVTRYSNNKHVLIKFVEHNHSPNASSADVAMAIEGLKTRARVTGDAPCQLIQTYMTSTAADIAPCLPSSNALRCQVRRIRRGQRTVELKALSDVHVPETLRKTLNGEQFLVKDAVVGEDRILLFTTTANIHKLSGAPMWLMDGTFRTTPNVFYQMYTIHATIGSRSFPLVYAMMSAESQALYTRLFEDLVDFAEEQELRLSPGIIMTDLELAAINAAKSEFEGVTNKLKAAPLVGIGIPPPDEIPVAFDQLKLQIPEEASDVTDWFESTYVHGRIRSRLRGPATARTPPLFPPAMWSVYDTTRDGLPRTQNSTEAWHRRWQVLVGGGHVAVYWAIEELRKEQRRVETECERLLGELSEARAHSALSHDQRLRNILNDRASRPHLMDYLRAIAYNLSL